MQAHLVLSHCHLRTVVPGQDWRRQRRQLVQRQEGVFWSYLASRIAADPTQADGKTLYVHLKEGGPSQPLNTATPRTASPAIAPQPEPVPVSVPMPEQPTEDVMMDVEQQYPTESTTLPIPTEPSSHSAYSRDSRDGRASYRDDYDRGPRRADGNYQDGRYGFNEQRYNEPRYDQDRRPRYRDEGRMYSDDMARGPRRGGRGRYRG